MYDKTKRALFFHLLKDSDREDAVHTDMSSDFFGVETGKYRRHADAAIPCGAFVIRIDDPRIDEFPVFSVSYLQAKRSGARILFQFEYRHETICVFQHKGKHPIRMSMGHEDRGETARLPIRIPLCVQDNSSPTVRCQDVASCQMIVQTVRFHVTLAVGCCWNIIEIQPLAGSFCSCPATKALFRKRTRDRSLSTRSFVSDDHEIISDEFASRMRAGSRMRLREFESEQRHGHRLQRDSTLRARILQLWKTVVAQ